ncbi:cytochrome P450 [Sorangium sp. So ce429]
MNSFYTQGEHNAPRRETHMTDQRINIFDPEFQRDPYPHYAVLRRDSPVCQVDPGGMWLVTRYDDVAIVLKDYARFSSAGFRKGWEPGWVTYNPLARSMVTADPPVHTRVRALIQRAFGPSAIARLESKAGELARELTQGLDGEMEVVEALSLPLPTFMIGEILGFDARQRGELKRWGDDVLCITPAPPSEADATRIRASIREITGYLREIVEARRLTPKDDTMTALVQAQVDGQALTTDEIVNNLVLLLLGGLETTTNLVSNALRLWSVQPDVFHAVRADPPCLGNFIEELLRYDAVGPMIPRLTMQEVELRGVTIPAGEMVVATIASANRDEQVFKDPERFDLKRDNHGAIPFGLGHHFCIGAALARMEARVLLGAILERVQRIEPCEGKIPYSCALTVRGPLSLRLRFTPA